MYEQLFANMQHHVDVEVKHYQKDLEYDKAEIMKFGKAGTTYYWLTRKCGTNLYNKRDLTVALDDWNTLWGLWYYRDYPDKHLYRIQITEIEGQLEGLLFPMDYDKVCADLKAHQKIPEAIVMCYEDKQLELPVTTHFSADEALGRFCVFADNNNIHWSDIDYSFKFDSPHV